MQDLLLSIQEELLGRAGQRGRAIYIWGAGNAGRVAAARLDQTGKHLSGIIDRDRSKAGMSIGSARVFPPDELTRHVPRPFVLIASMYHREISGQLQAMGFRPGRDFDLFPNEGCDLPLLMPEALLFSGWRQQWLKVCGLDVAAAIPRILLPAMPEEILSRLPADSASWVCLYGAETRVGDLHWLRKPDGGAGPQRAQVALDPRPPPTGRRRPFLMEWLIRAHFFPAPIVCQAGLIRAVLAATGELLTADRLAGHLDAAAPAPTAECLCEIRLGGGHGPEVRGPPGRSGLPAPILCDFATALAKERLPVFSEQEVKKVLPQITAYQLRPDAGYEYLATDAGGCASLRLQVVAHSRGNLFFMELRDWIAKVWERAGATVTVGTEEGRRRPSPWLSLVVAPHEFYGLGGGDRSWDAISEILLVNTEQPHTHWFAQCLPHLLAAKRVLDLNWQTALLLRTLGARAHFLPLGWDDTSSMRIPRQRLPDKPALAGIMPIARSFPADDAWEDRPIDLLFVGTLSPRRAGFFSRHARNFAPLRCFFHLPSGGEPLGIRSPDALGTRDMADLCRRAKIVLNLHRDDAPYFEWHRVVFQAMRQGALVVSESAMPVPGFVPGIHFVMVDASKLPSLIGRLLSPEGMSESAAIATRGAEEYRRMFPADHIAEKLCGLFCG